MPRTSLYNSGLPLSCATLSMGFSQKRNLTHSSSVCATSSLWADILLCVRRYRTSTISAPASISRNAHREHEAYARCAYFLVAHGAGALFRKSCAAPQCRLKNHNQQRLLPCAYTNSATASQQSAERHPISEEASARSAPIIRCL